MAHHYQSHREHGKARSRAGHVLKSAGDHHPHAVKDKGMLSHSFRVHEGHPGGHPAGYASGGRVEHRLAKYARGGKAKKHHTQVNIAVVSPGGSKEPAGAAPGGMGVPRPPMAGPPPAPPPALPPGGMAGGPPGLPPGLPPGMPPRPPMKRGGRITGGPQRMMHQKTKPHHHDPSTKQQKVDGEHVGFFEKDNMRKVKNGPAAGKVSNVMPAPLGKMHITGGTDTGMARKQMQDRYSGKSKVRG